MEDLTARSRFLFGTDEPPDDIGRVFPDPDAHGGIDLEDVPDRPWRIVQRLVADQVLAGEPAATWTTAGRLVELGLDRDEAFAQLCKGVFYCVYAAAAEVRAAQVTGVEPPMIDRLTRALERLPLPAVDDVVQTLAAVASTDQGIDVEMLLSRTAAEFGRDDEITAPYLKHVLRTALDDAYVLAAVPPERVVNRVTLAARVTLTHRLTQDDIAHDRLDLAPTDFCLLTHVRPVLDDGTELTSDGECWYGVPGWLASFTPGDLVALRAVDVPVDHKQTIVFERLDGDAPAADADLAAALRRAVEEVATDEGAAVPIGAAVARLLLDLPDAFAEPQVPVSEFCAAAGIELRGAYAGTTADHWIELHRQTRHERLHDMTDDDDAVHTALDALDTFEHDTAEPTDLRDAIRLLAADPAAAEFVLDELAEPDGDDDEFARAAAISGRIVASARRDAEVAVARWIAGGVAERAGRLADAEAHFRAAYVADPSFEPVVDRCAWYASDRGDAATAARLWSALAEPPIGELAEVRTFIHAPGNEPRRNDRCWCGSGRKYKVCHQRQPAQPALPDRVPWLYRKAQSFLLRRGGDAKLAVVGNVVALAGDDVGVMLSTAVHDPLVVDAALVEGGWFARFLDARGELLPDDERVLATSWLSVTRTVYEVEAGTGREIITLHDLRTGDRFEVAGNAIDDDRVGSRWCARALPDGTGHRILGAVCPVSADESNVVLELCERGDPLALCAHIGANARSGALPV